MGFDETISERISAGFISDTPTGKAQIRAAKVRSFFRDYENWNKEVDDGSLLQEREHELGITQEEWSEYHRFEIQF